ncbi:hypothetical protein ACFL20_13380 [Spirochaetota bacterium]
MVKQKKILFIIVFLSLFCFVGRGKLNTQPHLRKNLFYYSAGRNNVPAGNYRLIRSNGKVTQVLELRYSGIIIVYTDLDNSQKGRIKVSAYDRVKCRTIEFKKIRQYELNGIVENILLKGNTKINASHKYAGLESYLEKAKDNRASLTKIGSTFHLSIMKNKEVASKMTIDFIRRNLIIRNKFTDEITYPVIIKETGDPLIYGIIKKYAYEFYRMAKKK